MTSPGIGMMFGLVSTTTLHLAKGLQRHGIDTLRWRPGRGKRMSGKLTAVYLVGLVLNNIAPLWTILANRFAPPAYATGMYGVGLVVLLLYSHYVLDEPVTRRSYVGAAFIIIGTGLFAFSSPGAEAMSMVHMNVRAVVVISTVVVVCAIGAAVASLVLRRPRLIGFLLGGSSGAIGSMDAVLKALGQHAGGHPGYIPSVAWGWIPFGISFLFGVAAFMGIQLAFLKGAHAATAVSLQTSTYVIVPVAVQVIALPGYPVTPAVLAGIVGIVVGVILMQKENE